MTLDELLAIPPGSTGLDLGYCSALFLLAGLSGYPREKVEAAITILPFEVAGLDGHPTHEHGVQVAIDWPGLHQEHTFSTGERMIVETAFSLFRGAGGPSLGEITSTLDVYWIERCLDAARVRAGLYHYRIFTTT